MSSGLQVTLSLAATLVAFSSVVLGKKLNLAYSAKLYGIAFIIVTFGAVDEETTGTSIFLLASMVGLQSCTCLCLAYGTLPGLKSAQWMLPMSPCFHCQSLQNCRHA